MVGVCVRQIPAPLLSFRTRCGLSPSGVYWAGNALLCMTTRPKGSEEPTSPGSYRRQLAPAKERTDGQEVEQTTPNASTTPGVADLPHGRNTKVDTFDLHGDMSAVSDEHSHTEPEEGRPRTPSLAPPAAQHRFPRPRIPPLPSPERPAALLIFHLPWAWVGCSPSVAGQKQPDYRLFRQAGVSLWCLQRLGAIAACATGGRPTASVLCLLSLIYTSLAAGLES